MLGANVLSTALWAMVGGFCGAVIAPLMKQLPNTRWFALAGAVLGALVYFREDFRGKLGIPIVSLAGAVAGWLLGFIVYVWQIAAVAVIAGAAGGAYLGSRLQERFTRNTTRGPGAGGFYGG